jgi:preprotein translocase subunit SecF
MRKDFKIVEKSKLWYSISIGIIFLGALFMLIFSGLNLGIDFTGGSTIEVNTGTFITLNNENKESVKEFCINYFEESQMDVKAPQYTETTDGGALEFKFQQKINGNDVTLTEFNTKVDAMKIELLSKLTEEYKEYTTASFEINSYTITSTASSELIKNTIISVLVAVALILLYIAIRFTLSSGFAAVVALVHDVLIMLSLTIIFRIQVNASFIAAVITIIGYSINATIIVFDKVRENSKSSQFAEGDYKGIMNASITQTFNRTVFSSITTMVTITMLAILGVPAIREFAIPIIFGLISGTYSSFVMSGSLWVAFQKIAAKRRNSDKYKAKKAAKKREAELA